MLAIPGVVNPLTPRSPLRSRLVAISLTLLFVVAALSGLGCSSSDAPPEGTDYEGDDGGGTVQTPGPGAPVEGEDDAGAKPPPPPSDGGKADAGPARPPNGCPALAFPSGVTLQTKPDAKMTAQYTSISDTGDYPLPKCFIDIDDLYDPTTGQVHDINVMVGKYFSLAEMVGTELSYGHKVLLSPTLIAKLDAYRMNLGKSVNITSGYRSPAHQRAVCRSICGMDACPPQCATRSRHSWGDAADHGVYPTKVYSDAACAAKFNFVYREGDHVHVDLNPAHQICTVQIL